MKRKYRVREIVTTDLNEECELITKVQYEVCERPFFHMFGWKRCIIPRMEIVDDILFVYPYDVIECLYDNLDDAFEAWTFFSRISKVCGQEIHGYARLVNRGTENSYVKEYWFASENVFPSKDSKGEKCYEVVLYDSYEKVSNILIRRKFVPKVKKGKWIY